MAPRTRYRLDRIDVAPLGSRPASWTFAGEAVRGMEFSYVALDRNLTTRNHWEFLVRVPEDPKGRVEVRPRTAPAHRAWEELPDRSLTFTPATRGAARGRWYCPVALADPTGERSRTVVRHGERNHLPSWFRDLAGRMRRKETVKVTRGTDSDSLVVLVAPGDYADMIRLFFATKVWILREAVVLPARE
ncbi:MAG TPA: hypothetical protein VJK71_06665 [Gemmatimonadales bacterium]|nr:hypothetical protein [Gemmatimonadales bacterium]